MGVNITSIKTSSNGAWQGDNPLDYAFPLLIVQTTLILVVSRFLAFLLKPLRQPKVIAEIVGGILLGPSALGKNKHYLHRIFPSWSTPILESVASIGLLFFLFLVGLELDLSSIRRSGRKAFGIAAAGISLPFVCGIGVAIVLRKTVDGADKVGFGQFLVFMGVALSITAFPVLARILAELKLLTTELGETAMAAAAFNDVAAWILLALAVALAGDGDGGGHKSPFISIWVLLSGAAFVTFMLVVIAPAMKWVARRCSPQNDVVDEAYICLTLAGVLVSGFMTDLIGIHSIFGAFVFGLTIPKGGQFADRLIERIEDFVTGLLLPLYFASSGLKTDVAKIRGGKAWGLLALVISTACAGKILGTFVVALMFMIPVRESLTLGVLMNTKGLVELIVLNIGKEKKVLNDEMFAILVLMALFTTFITTPTVMAIYKPARGNSAHTHRKLRLTTSTQDTTDELRVLACVHGPGNVPSLINLIESTRSTKKSLVKLFVVHLVELTERSSSIVMVQRVRRNGFPFFNRIRRGEWHDRMAGAFQAYSQLGRVRVRPTTAISALSTMHEDICHVAEDKRVTLIILPFHKMWKGEGDEMEENVGHGWRGVNQRVLKNAPCSVAVFVDRGLGNGAQTPVPTTTTAAQRVCVIFFGGPDDREALALGGRMAEHPAIKVTVIRFVEKEGKESRDMMLRLSSTNKYSEHNYSFSTAKMNREKERELDENTVAEFRSKWDGIVEYSDKVTSNIVEAVLTIGPDADGSASFRKTIQRQEEKWWLPVPRVAPSGLSENSRKLLHHTRECASQILKAAMAINSIALAEMEVPESYLEALPKNGRACLGDVIYRYITSDHFSAECLLDYLDLSSEHVALEIANRVEASVYVWRRRAHARLPPNPNRSTAKSSWEMVKDLMLDGDKRELLAEKAESLLLCLKQRFPGLTQTTLDTSKIQCNKDVGKSIIESYSRVLESLAFNIVARIDDLLYVDDLTKHSDRLSSAPTVSVISHKTVSIPYSVPDSSTPYKTTFSTPSFSPAPLISPARGERTPFLFNRHSKPPRRGFGVKRVLTNYLGVDSKARISGNPTEVLASTPKLSSAEGLECHKESTAQQNGTKLSQAR